MSSLASAMSSLDAVTKAIGAAGSTVQQHGQDKRSVVEAMNEETDEAFVVMTCISWSLNWRSNAGSSWS